MLYGKGSMEKIKIGKIVNAVGLKGEVKVYNYSNEKERYEELEDILIEEKIYNIQKVRYKDNMVILKLKNVDNRNDAEDLKNKSLFIDEEDLPALNEGEYYIKDLIGFDVALETGEKIGILIDVITERVQDLYCIKNTEGKVIYLPRVKEFVLKIDIEEKLISVKLPEGLLEL